MGGNYLFSKWFLRGQWLQEEEARFVSLPTVVGNEM